MAETSDLSVFRPASVIMAGRVVGFAAMFAVPIVLVRIFDQSGFGTYKQIFLIYGTLFTLAQIGMAQSLYYFVPSAERRGGGYIANALGVLSVTGAVLLIALWLNADRVAAWMNNPELARYLPYVGVFLLMMLMSVVLEIAMIARNRSRHAFVAYAATDAARAALFMAPALLLHSLTALMVGAIAFAAFRLAATVVYIKKQYAGELAFDPARLKRHLAYALPFALAVGIQVVQSRLHMYFVSARFDVATFAIYAVGCLQIPLTDIFMSSTASVMMVRMKETLNGGSASRAVSIWQGTTRKLMLIFAGLAGVLVVSAHALIVTLYTPAYAASVPIFEIFSAGLVFAPLLTRSIMRVYAQTRFMIVIKLVKLGVLGGIIVFLVNLIGLLGAVCAVLAAELAGEILGLWRGKKVMRRTLGNFLPWKSLGGIVLIAIVAALPALAVRMYVEIPIIAKLFLIPVVFGVVYVVLVWRYGPIRRDEKATVVRMLQRRAVPVWEWLVRAGCRAFGGLSHRGKRRIWYALDLSEARDDVSGCANGIEVLRCDSASISAVPRSSRAGGLSSLRRLVRGEAELWIARNGGIAVASVWAFRGRTPVLAAPGGWLRLPAGHACLQDAVTAPPYRGQRIAADLWMRVAENLAADGVQTVLLQIGEDNRAAVRAAEKAGFRPLATMVLQRRWLRARVRVSGRGGASAPGFLLEQLAR